MSSIIMTVRGRLCVLRSTLMRSTVAGVLILSSFLVGASPADAVLELTKTFALEGEGEGAFISSARGISVSENNGDFYVANTAGDRILKYGPEGEFREAWGWGVASSKESSFQRCGPEGEPDGGEPHRACSGERGVSNGDPGGFEAPEGVAVDQTNGNVYISDSQRLNGVIQEFNPKGEVIASFGVKASFGQRVSESPDLIHTVNYGDIAVSTSGDVYLVDSQEGSEARIMVWRPKAGSGFKEYELATTYKDEAVGQGRIVIDDSSDVYAVNGEGEKVYKYPSSDFNTASGEPAPSCKLVFRTGGIEALSWNPEWSPGLLSHKHPLSGEVFFSSYKEEGIFSSVDVCTETEAKQEKEEKVNQFKGVADTESKGISFSPLASLRANTGLVRPTGALYATSEGGGMPGRGLIFAGPPVSAPSVGAESVSGVGASSATLSAVVDSNGYSTYYGFQYITEAAYLANDPNTRQSVTVSAPGGLFSLSFEGQSTGGVGVGGVTGTGSVVSGSHVVGSLVTGAGSGDLSAGSGSGKLVKGSNEVKAVSVSSGAFAAGQVISGEGIPDGTIIVDAEPGRLVLSREATMSGTAVALSAGSREVTGVSVSLGRFVVGAVVSGVGIPAGTTITGVGASSLTLSVPVTAGGSGVALSSSGPLPFAVGQEVSGAGIPTGAKIVSVGAGSLTLSVEAMASGSGVSLVSGLPYNASAGEVQEALDGLSSIGGAGGSVEVGGGPGGSSPYDLTFGGSLSDVEIAALISEATSGSVDVTIENPGGSGFNGAQSAPLLTSGALLSLSGVAKETVSGLQPDTTYRYRVVATHCGSSEVGVPGCAVKDVAGRFHTFPEGLPRLPDERVYELVSPIEKGDGEVFVNNPSFQEPGEILATGDPMPRVSSADGDSIVYEGGPFATNGDAPFADEYHSTRTPTGWQTSVLSPASTTGLPGYNAFSADLSHGVLAEGGQEPTLCAQAPAGYDNLYLQDGECEGHPGWQPLIATSPPHRPARGLRAELEGESTDLSHIVFAANDSLIPGEGALETELSGDVEKEVQVNKNNNYLYDWTGTGSLDLIDVLPEAEGGGVAPNAVLGSGTGPNEAPDLDNALSTNGERAFWSDQESGHLYVRIDDRETVEVPDTTAGAVFLTASTDGSKVLLSDGHLYELHEEEGSSQEVQINDLTDGKGGMQGILGTSEDLSTVYFVDTAKLTNEERENAPGHREHPTAGADNLYVAHNSAIKYIGTLESGDGAIILKSGDWTHSPDNRLAEASPNGEYLAFMSTAPLTGYKNTYENKKTYEDFEYSTSAERLVCVSCSPTDTAPRGSGLSELAQSVTRYVPQPRYLMNNGRLFFESNEALSPYDNSENVEELYEYEPEGLGSCQENQNENEQGKGCVYLISAGRGNNNSRFIAADSTGENVFFTTRDQLVKADKDDLIDVYDARIKGGFVEPALPSCLGAECQGISSIPPTFATPPSATFTGTGNYTITTTPSKPETKQCPKGKRLNHNKCVVVKKARRKRPPKGHKKNNKTNHRSLTRTTRDLKHRHSDRASRNTKPQQSLARTGK